LGERNKDNQQELTKLCLKPTSNEWIRNEPKGFNLFWWFISPQLAALGLLISGQWIPRLAAGGSFETLS
jgi:hypothetical protein